jgi:hypothetical protein
LAHATARVLCKYDAQTQDEEKPTDIITKPSKPYLDRTLRLDFRRLMSRNANSFGPLKPAQNKIP